MTKHLLLTISLVCILNIVRGQQPSVIKIRKDTSDLHEGRQLYILNCVVCHDDPKRGPKLNGITDKYPKQWVLDFTENSERLIHLKDKDALKIWLEWKKEPMTVYEGGVTKKQLEQLYIYLKTLKAPEH
jgi:hypothetical protein